MVRERAEISMETEVEGDDEFTEEEQQRDQAELAQDRAIARLEPARLMTNAMLSVIDIGKRLTGLEKHEQDRLAQEEQAVYQQFSKPSFDIRAFDDRRKAHTASVIDDIGAGDTGDVYVDWSGDRVGGGRKAKWKHPVGKPTVNMPWWDISDKRLEARVRAKGRANTIRYYSRLHVWSTFRAEPPESGILEVIAPYLVHGLNWWKWSHSPVLFDDFALDLGMNLSFYIDVKQHGVWLGPEKKVRISDVNQFVKGRLDETIHVRGSWNVAASDPVTIRVGARLHCSAKNKKNYSQMDYYEGDGNYIETQGVHVLLYH